MAHAFALDRIPGAPWRPLEIAGIILGLMIFWPLAFAYVGWRLWKASRQAGTTVSFDFSAFRPAAGGNTAFEAYKRETLARLEAERRKLREEEREFAEFLRELRRAKDQDEFDRFMASRRGAGAA